MTDAATSESPTTAADAAPRVADAPHAGDHEHTSDGVYIKIAALLAVFTAAEVAWPYLIDDGPLLMWPLLVVMAIKFVVIASYFMHLKFDSKVLTRVFYTGLVLAVSVYVAALLTFQVFGN
ncbi:cytochrome C oxidase subunit IV family protein [Iamia sp.]|uniref:cytochrome C oxidase subunit IV family protein n=1 Tax=Iamia sp. TaxID=2722710 RepID=UPI002CCB36BC|nr:cytochrome C oxidase subunit IV family protein [Iamia sp.]HXH56658.1 cytochrome C oxidase subunit IV family protein [Iamia sp.]